MHTSFCDTLNSGISMRLSRVCCATFFLLYAIPTWPQRSVDQTQEFSVASADLPDETLEKVLARLPSGPEHDFFAGILATRAGHDEEAVHLFTSAAPGLRHTQPDESAMALRLLADTYDRMGRYADSAPVYDELEHSGLVKTLPYIYRTGVKDDAELARVLSKSPAQTLTWTGPVHLATSRKNPLGVITTDLSIHGVRSAWILDTGANQSVISRTLADQLHLAMLPGIAHTASGVTGIENPLRVALLPEMSLGNATAHNVPLLVLDDANLTISVGKDQTYRIAGVIGLPVLRALGCVTFHHEGTLDAREACDSTARGSHLEFHMLTPVVLPVVEGQTLPFTLDTGASGTSLSVRFYKRFASEQPSWIASKTINGGAGGNIVTSTFSIPSVTFALGGQNVTVHKLSVSPEEQHADIDALFGNMGEDVLQSVSSFTLDFPRMWIIMGTNLPDQRK
jgi:predicted aspartyl protease